MYFTAHLSKPINEVKLYEQSTIKKEKQHEAFRRQLR